MIQNFFFEHAKGVQKHSARFKKKKQQNQFKKRLILLKNNFDLLNLTEIHFNNSISTTHTLQLFKILKRQVFDNCYNGNFCERQFLTL